MCLYLFVTKQQIITERIEQQKQKDECRRNSFQKKKFIEYKGISFDEKLCFYGQTKPFRFPFFDLCVFKNNEIPLSKILAI